jgi:hypothetical protein
MHQGVRKSSPLLEKRLPEADIGEGHTPDRSSAPSFSSLVALVQAIENSMTDDIWPPPATIRLVLWKWRLSASRTRLTAI